MSKGIRIAWIVKAEHTLLSPKLAVSHHARTTGPWSQADILRGVYNDSCLQHRHLLFVLHSNTPNIVRNERRDLQKCLKTYLHKHMHARALSMYSTVGSIWPGQSWLKLETRRLIVLGCVPLMVYRVQGFSSRSL